jgi:hypothetical protein
MDARLGVLAPEPDRNLALELVRATESRSGAVRLIETRHQLGKSNLIARPG